MAQPPFNPYAPPQTPDLALPEVPFGDFDIARTVTDAWDAVKRHFPLWLGVGFVGTLLSFLAMITCIGYFVLVPVFAWGMVKFLLNMIDNRPSFDDLFAGFRDYLAVLGRTLLLLVIFLFMAGVSESLVFVGQYLRSTPVQVVGWLVYMVFSVAVLIRLYFSFFLVVDKNLGALDALAASWRMTERKTWKVFGLSILMMLVGASGVLACGIGLLVTITMSYLMFASAYRQMAGAPAPAPVPAWYAAS